MFRDEAEIEVLAGKGGDGAVSFRREKYVPRGGPDGGDGGRGGSVILVASSRLHSLLDISRKRKYAAAKGRPGGTRRKSGPAGDDLVLELPIGTMIHDAKRGNLLRDLCEEGMTLEVARGGRGGKGNQHFATSVNQAPNHAVKGAEGEHRQLKLELKLFAEVGLVGLPNAGKSTFLTVVTAATPKVADYPFTTLEPQVGIARVGAFDTLVLADLPGLIEGAAEGIGLGHRFLKHVERCGVLIHLVDVSPSADTEPEEALAVIEKELGAFEGVLLQKPRLIVASKCEGAEAEERADELERHVGRPILRISSAERRGVQELLAQAHQTVRGAGEPS